MGKRSQAQNRWPKRERTPHTYVDWITDTAGMVHRVVTMGNTRTPTAVLENMFRVDAKGVR